MLINFPLFQAMFKQQKSNLFKISLGIVLYEDLLTWVYPAISKTPAVAEIVGSIPSSVKTVFGVSGNARSDTFEAFISSQFFARIWTMIMAFYGINTANALLAKLIDDGSLAFPLSCSISRKEILSTQVTVLIANNSLLITTTLSGLLVGTTLFGININKANYARLGLLSFSFFSVISAYAFLFSTLATKEKSLAYAYGLTFLFYALDVIAGLTDKLRWAGKISLFRILKPQEVLEGTIDTAGAVAGLLLSSGILLSVAAHFFVEKDLCL